MKIFASSLSRFFLFAVLCELFQTIFSQSGPQNKNVFQVLTDPKLFSKTSDIITFKPNDYTASPWNFVMSDLLDSGDFKKSASFWIRHNMTQPPASTITLVRGASTTSKTPVIATDAHFLVFLEASGNNIQIKLRYLVSGNTVARETIVSNINLQPYVWYGVFISRISSTDDRGILFVYDPSTIDGTNYRSDLQFQNSTPVGYQKAGATSRFYIDVGGDSQTGIACNCEITNFNFLYKGDYYDAPETIMELIKQPPKLMLWLQYKELDNTLQLVTDDSNANNVVFRGDSQFDTNRDSQLNYDLTANGEIGHVYSQSGFDTIYPAFDLGREFTISFWIKFTQRPSSVTNDTFQPVFFKQNALYPDMKVYLAFQTTVDTVTGIYVQTGMTGKTETLAAPISRTDNTWYYFSVSYANFYKNVSAVDFTFHPTTLYTIRYTLATGLMATPITGLLDDSFIHSGTTDTMRIGMGVDGQNENLFATIKKFQIFSGSWAFDVLNDTCLHAIGGDKVTHITQGQLSTHTFCQTCTGGYNLTDNDCMGNCPDSYYSVNDTNYFHCENCYENCLTCIGRKSQQCESCIFGSWDPFGVLTCPGKNPCNSHQFDLNSVCVECNDECATCKEKISCTACAQGYAYNQVTHQCEIRICGDGVVDAGEQCDDGNQVSGDGCSSTCTVELGWYCNFGGGACYSICGDNVRASNEQCDDGNNNNGDGCAYNCTVEDTYFCTQDPAKIGPFTDITYKENCTQCDPQCKVCATVDTCTQCQAGKFLYNGRCQDNCTESGLYQDTASLSCKTCPNLCAECTNSTFCTSCTGSAALLNNKCYATCPNGKYNGLDSGVRRCLDCPAHCVTCASDTSCYTCESGYFLDSSGSCSACDGTCKTCRGPAATDCVLCAQGLTLQKSTSTCIVLECEANQFTNLDLGECQNCHETCATCFNTLETGCLTCDSDKALSLSNRCLDCNAANGLTFNTDEVCVEICGDGKRVTNATKCDDGNLEDGDGCSSTCTIETGWSCSGGSETTADTCVSIVGPMPIITIDPDDPASFVISFDRQIKNTLQDKELLSQIIVTLEGVQAVNSDYQIFYNSQTQTFKVVFDLKESVLDSMLFVQFKDPSRITDLFGNPVSPAITKQVFPKFYYVDQEESRTASGLSTFSLVIQSINTVTVIPLALTGYLAHYWMFVEYFQIVHDLIYINVRTPYVVDEFFRSFRFLQLSWLPNAPQDADMNYDRASQLGDYKFQYTNTLFLENAGYQLTTWAFLIAVWILLKAIIKVGIKKSLLKYLIYNIMINLEWSIILRAVIETFFDFCLFTYLQLSNFSTSEPVVTASSLLSIVALVFTLGFPIFCILKTVKIRNMYLLDRETKYDTLYREYRKKRGTTTAFIAFSLFQKVLIAAIIVGLQASPETQIALFAVEQIIMLLILIIMRPYVDGSMNFRAIVQELILFAVVALFYGLLNENTDENVRDNVGRVMVALLIIALLMHCAFLIKDSYHAIKEHIQTPENSRKIFGKVKITPGPDGQDEFRISRGSELGSSGQLDAPGSEANLISNNGYRAVEPNADTVGDTILGEELSKPSATKIKDDSLIKDDEPVQTVQISVAPSQTSVAGEGDKLIGV